MDADIKPDPSLTTLTEHSFPPHAKDYPKLDLPEIPKVKLPFKTRFMIRWTRSTDHMMMHVEKMDVAITRAFLETGVSPNSCDIDGVTALALAVKKGHLQMAKLLLSRGADPNLPTGPGPEPEMPLHIAIVYRNKQMVELLLDNGAKINATPSPHLRKKTHKYQVDSKLIPSRLNNLTACMRNDDLDMFRHLIKRGALYKEEYFGVTSCRLDHHSSPLRTAIAQNKARFIDVLLEKNVLETFERRPTRCPHIDPLGVAMESVNFDFIRKFAALGMDMKTPFATCPRLWRLSNQPMILMKALTPLEYAQNLELPSLQALLSSLLEDFQIEKPIGVGVEHSIGVGASGVSSKIALANPSSQENI